MGKGTDYVLARDRAALEMSKPEKTCKRCKATKPNTFDHFNKRWCGTRTNFATVDVCKECTYSKARETREEKRRLEEAAMDELATMRQKASRDAAD